MDETTKQPQIESRSEPLSETRSDTFSAEDAGVEVLALTQADILQLLGSVDTKEEMEARLIALHELGSVLGRKLRPERIAEVFRRPAPAFGNASMLELIGLGRHDEVLRSVNDSFDWSRTA